MPDAPQLRPLDVIKAAARKAEIDRDWAAAALAK
jgi:putative spermidine/putrescine transport system substrate-binding protein